MNENPTVPPPSTALGARATALGPVSDGATVLVGGFGEIGVPFGLLRALEESGAQHLTVVANNAGVAERGLAALLKSGQVSRIICSYPRSVGSHVFEDLYRRRAIQLELVPQGILSERIRAGGAGIGPFYSPVGARTELAFGKPWRDFGGQRYVLENPIVGDLALIRAASADRMGNLNYRASARNLNVVMATAAKRTVAEVDEILVGSYLHPEHIVTPSIFIDTVQQSDVMA